MKKNSLYDGQKINANEPGEQSPPEYEECPEECECCPESRDPADCTEVYCRRGMDAETAADRKLHAMRDEGECE